MKEYPHTNNYVIFFLYIIASRLGIKEPLRSPELSQPDHRNRQVTRKNRALGSHSRHQRV